jgi:cytochrome c oxidase cbb3-type subunit I/II
MTQASVISTNLKTDGIQIASDREVIALIAYVQRLGKDISVK